MTQLELIPTRVNEGVWHGILHGAPPEDDAAPAIHVTHQEQPVPDVTLDRGDTPGHWLVSFPLPPRALSDGVQTILIADGDGARLGTFVIAMGDALDGDIRAEIDLLRAELDMLKRAFRRHCVETA
ncbi:hypothetical protein [Oceaniglobus indicus]|uniref:hypothetical protein n=1 Tax=Oceaniglobus indicus TaxID=2047749 RepID=UPI000C18166F|nr:hypothetical protein [Oceaniglobus indicus]